MPLEGRITIRSAKRLMFVIWFASLAVAGPFAIYRNYKVVRARVCVLKLTSAILAFHFRHLRHFRHSRLYCVPIFFDWCRVLTWYAPSPTCGASNWNKSTQPWRRMRHHSKQVFVMFPCFFFVVFSRFSLFVCRKERHWKNFTEKFCMENITILPIYWHIVLIVLVLCPLTVMIICYTAIFWKVI